MKYIDECNEENGIDDFEEEPHHKKSKNTAKNGASRNIIKTNYSQEDKSCVLMKNLQNINMIPVGAIKETNTKT